MIRFQHVPRTIGEPGAGEHRRDVDVLEQALVGAVRLGCEAHVLVSQAPFLILSGWQVVVMVRRRTFDRGSVFLLSFLAFSVAPFFIGGHFFPHYVVQAIPALVLLTLERISELESASVSSGRALRYARAYILINIVAFSIANGLYYARVPAETPSPHLVRFVREHTAARDALFVWTLQSHFLLEVDRPYATRFLRNEFLTGRLFVSPNRLPDATAEQRIATGFHRNTMPNDRG